MKKLLSFLLLSLLTITTLNLSYAQLQGDTDDLDTSCINISYNMRYRSRDITTNNEVTDLQDFLISEGYMTGNTTGYFGLLTQKAVKSFQSRNNLISSGIVGAVTRAKIKDISCNTSYTNPVTPPVSAIPTNPITPIACTMEARFCPSGEVMRRDLGTCRWKSEMCKGESSINRIPNITSVIIANDNSMTIYGSNLDLAKNFFLGSSLNQNIDIRSTFNNAVITSNYIKLEDVRIKLGKYIVNTDVGYDLNITLNNDGSGTTSNTFRFFVPAWKAPAGSDMKITGLSAGELYGQPVLANGNKIFEISVTGENLSKVWSVEIDGGKIERNVFYNNSFKNFTNNQFSFNISVCPGCKYTSSIVVKDSNGNASNAMNILIDNSSNSMPQSTKSRLFFTSPVTQLESGAPYNVCLDSDSVDQFEPIYFRIVPVEKGVDSVLGTSNLGGLKSAGCYYKFSIPADISGLYYIEAYNSSRSVLARTENVSIKGSAKITGMSLSQVRTGDRVTLFGKDIPQLSAVYLGTGANVVAANYESYSSEAVSFIVPTIAPGLYPIYIFTATFYGSKESNQLFINIVN